MQCSQKEQKKKIKILKCIHVECLRRIGDVPTREAIETMKNYEIDLRQHRATNIRNSNIKDMDVILCATTSHKNSVISMYPELKDKIYTMKEYAEYDKNDMDIKDPWGYGIDVYKKCAKEIEECINEYIRRIK